MTTKMPQKRRIKKSKQTKVRLFEDEIKLAARSIPDIIAGDMDMGGGSVSVSDNEKKRRTVFVGVGVLTMIIFGMWFINVRQMIARVGNSSSIEGAILEKSARDLNENIHSLSEDSARSSENLALIKQKIQNTLKNALIIPSATATSTSSTRS